MEKIIAVHDLMREQFLLHSHFSGGNVAARDVLKELRIAGMQMTFDSYQMTLTGFSTTNLSKDYASALFVHSALLPAA
jgi:hypothetical protein